MDRGGSSKRLEILTSSDSASHDQDQEHADFKLVGRCDLREEVLVYFMHQNFKQHASFPELPPDPPPHAKLQELWSPRSLGSVAQLRLSVPYGGAASTLGIKSLAVWGVPAHSCTSSDIEKFWKAHHESLKSKLKPVTTQRSKPESAQSDPVETPVPEEFLDPLTQELMVLPMILPSGMVVDSSTLEEYQKREATWGRSPNDPFTGVTFTKDSKPLPNPLLKSRIDGLMLRSGCTGTGSRKDVMNKPQSSRLVSPTEAGRPSCSTDLDFVPSLQVGPAKGERSVVLRTSDTKIQSRTCGEKQAYKLGSPSQSYSSKCKILGCSTKRKYQTSPSSGSEQLAPDDQSPLNKMPRADASVALSTERSPISHEQRLSDSLDQALTSALNGLPCYTENSKQEPVATAGLNRCGSCLCSLSVYSSSTLAYSLPCAHLLCRSCLHHQHHKPRVTCPTCTASTSPSSVTRVHL